MKRRNFAITGVIAVALALAWPSAAIAATPTVTIVVADTELTVGETSTVTFTFADAVTGFTNADLTPSNGTLSIVGSSDGGITWTATFTPTADLTDASNIITMDMTGVIDLVSSDWGVGTADSNNYAIDTARPTATAVITDTTLAAGETTTVTITFSEAVTDFDNNDISIPNGTLTPVSSADAGVTWTTTFTPDGNTASSGNVFVVNLAGVADSAGNDGTGTVNSNVFAVQAAAAGPAEILPVTGAEVHQLPSIALFLTASGLGMFLFSQRRRAQTPMPPSASPSR